MHAAPSPAVSGGRTPLEQSSSETYKTRTPRGASWSQILEKPFGPFLEEETLTSACKNTTARNVLSLRQVILECGGEITGLDECEKCQPDFDKKRFAQKPIRFRGILEIWHLSWLTKEAIEEIERQIHARVTRNLSASGGLNATVGGLSLEKLYQSTPGFHGGQRRVKVEIQGVKPLPVVYLYSKFGPGELVINSKAQHVPSHCLSSTPTQRKGFRGRRYTVKSLHIYTFQLSQLVRHLIFAQVQTTHQFTQYLSRYRIMRTLQDLLQLDANTNHWEFNTTPVSKRTPTWFVDLYLKHMAQLGAARKYRPAHDSDGDSDIEPRGGGALKRPREHTLRHVSRAEVYSLFAMHAEWIVTQVAQMLRNKWLAVDAWRSWTFDIRRTRRAAAQGGVSWGMHPGVEVTLDNTDSRDSPPLPAARAKRKTKVAQRGSPVPHTSRTSSATASTSYAGRDGSYRRGLSVDDTMLRTYDPDFSPESTPPGTPSSSSSGALSRAGSPVNPDIAALIPSSFFQPPQVTATYRWVCTECSYMIDLLHLTEEDLAVDEISEEERRKLRGQSWSVRDSWVREAFGYMVDKHLQRHLLEDYGVKIGMQGKSVKVSLTHPPVTHLHSGQLRVVKKDNRRPVIKQEDD
ncbi:hypothetical protein C8Q79DRAFT_1005127 [Trametes meyenii]|nr:hypothetical protein C8Q79DRAFT_1005127 [Trametes meyenii]